MSVNKKHNFIFGIVISFLASFLMLMGWFSVASTLYITYFSVIAFLASASLNTLGHLFSCTYTHNNVKINQQNNNSKLFDYVLIGNVALMSNALGSLFTVDDDWGPWLTEVSVLVFIVTIILTAYYGVKAVESEDDYNENSKTR